VGDIKFLPEGRNYPQLFIALDEAIASLMSGRTEESLLESSFATVSDGFGAEKAILLLVLPGGKLRAIASRGLHAEAVAACEAGRSVDGISSSMVKEAASSGRPALVQDPRHLAPSQMTRALEGQPYSVLCAAIPDPVRKKPIAVFYAQNSGFDNGYGELDLSFVEVWANVMGRVLSAVGNPLGSR
jgi:hypothetical protein